MESGMWREQGTGCKDRDKADGETRSAVAPILHRRSVAFCGVLWSPMFLADSCRMLTAAGRHGSRLAATLRCRWDAGITLETVPFTAGDGFGCNLIHARGDGASPTKGPVLLVHGAGVRAGLFLAPVETTLVDALLAKGYDVWLENWRASIDLRPNLWTLDQAARYDHPEAVKKVVAETGWKEIKAVIHCQGSTSFMMSAVAGLVPEVKVIVSNAVSLHPVVPAITKFKISASVPVMKRMTDYLNPQWCVDAPTMAAKAIKALVLLTHHECHNPVCKGVSFTYGTGFPALWDHANLNDATHEWIKGSLLRCR